MSTPHQGSIAVVADDEERYELYRILDVRRKIESGQAYIEISRVMRGPPRGFPPGTQSRIIRIKLAVNDWVLCYAHQYVSASGQELTRPDPKLIRIDDVTFRQGRLGS